MGKAFNGGKRIVIAVAEDIGGAIVVILDTPGQLEPILWVTGFGLAIVMFRDVFGIPEHPDRIHTRSNNRCHQLNHRRHLGNYLSHISDRQQHKGARIHHDSRQPRRNQTIPHRPPNHMHEVQQPDRRHARNHTDRSKRVRVPNAALRPARRMAQAARKHVHGLAIVRPRPQREQLFC